MDSPLLDFDRAVADVWDETVPGHYGDLVGEAWDLEKGTALSDLSDLGVVEVSGPDRLSWLTALSSQKLEGMSLGQSREALLLTPNGRIDFAFGIIDNGEAATLIVEGDRSQALSEFLTRMRFMNRVEIEDVSERVAVVGHIVARQSDPADPSDQRKELVVKHPAYLGTWVDPWPGVCEGGATYMPPRFDHPAKKRERQLHLVQRSQLADVVNAWLDAGNSLAGRNAWEALRIEDFRPRYGREVDDKALPHELDWLRTAVHLNKGCYCGQEAIARVVNMGKPPRRIVLLQLDGSTSATVQMGDAVVLGSRQVGHVTSVARHPDWGLMALALVRRSVGVNVQLDVQTKEGPVAAAQEVIVDPEGKSSASPKSRPGAELRQIRLQRP